MMTVAVIFNSDDPRFGGDYGRPIHDLILRTSILQASKRVITVRHGDVLIYSQVRNATEYSRLAESVYFAKTWSRLAKTRIRASYMRQTLFAWVISNVTMSIAEHLHAALRPEGSYLGLHAVDYGWPSHRDFYIARMVHLFQVCGSVCELPFELPEERDLSEVEHLAALGFKSVRWEGDYVAAEAATA